MLFHRAGDVGNTVCKSRSCEYSQYEMYHIPAFGTQGHYTILPRRLKVTLLHYVMDVTVHTLLYSCLLVRHIFDFPS